MWSPPCGGCGAPAPLGQFQPRYRFAVLIAARNEEAVLGNLLYKDKSTRLGFVNEKFVSPVTFVGRHSLLFYLLSQGIGVALLFILVTLGWL